MNIINALRKLQDRRIRKWVTKLIVTKNPYVGSEKYFRYYADEIESYIKGEPSPALEREKQKSPADNVLPKKGQ